MEKNSNEVSKTLPVPSTEERKKSVEATFHSVKLINEIDKKKTLTDAEKERRKRNVQHLEIMMKHEWFQDELAEDQKKEIMALLPEKKS